MQDIASCESEIKDPSTNEEKREELKNMVQEYERYIQAYKHQINRCEAKMQQIEIGYKGESII